MHEVLAQLPDLVLHECTHLFDTRSLERYLGDAYYLMPVKMNPLEVGWPNNRPRTIVWCVNKMTTR
eukprot:5548682-Alexandrium_andersonii.AAC.1